MIIQSRLSTVTTFPLGSTTTRAALSLIAPSTLPRAARQKSRVPSTPTATPWAARARAWPVSTTLVSQYYVAQSQRNITDQFFIHSGQRQLLHGQPQHAGDLPAFWRQVLQLLQCVLSSYLIRCRYTDLTNVHCRAKLPERLRLRVRRVQRQRPLHLRRGSRGRLHDHLLPLKILSLIRA